MYYRTRLFLLLFLTTILPLHAGPLLSVDQTTLDCGAVDEGTSMIAGKFIVENRGDAPLSIKVRPGCGCTVVEYDSLIAPGKKTAIETEVEIGHASGVVSKSMNVTSNDPEKASVRLTITARVITHIETSQEHINLDNSQNNTVLNLFSKKPDLKISRVVFLPSDARGPVWQKTLPLALNYSWIPTDSLRADSAKVFRLELPPVDTDEKMYGEFVISTNHPKKKELIISGSLNR